MRSKQNIGRQRIRIVAEAVSCDTVLNGGVSAAITKKEHISEGRLATDGKQESLLHKFVE